MTRWTRKHKKSRYRSGLEDRIAKELEDQKVKYYYETEVIQYVKPETSHKYTLDFKLNNGVLIETKGYFDAEDRKKHLCIKASNPSKDIRFVFQNSNNKIRKGSKTTYAMWCDKHGFKWAQGSVPKEWIDE